MMGNVYSLPSSLMLFTTSPYIMYMHVYIMYMHVYTTCHAHVVVYMDHY